MDYAARVPRIRVTQHVSAPRDQVWAFYTDHEGWSDWVGGITVRLTQTGEPERNGVGAVRAIGASPVTVHEEVTAFEPPRRMVYRIVQGGGPIRNHEGEVLFEDRDGGTFITWSCYFDPIVPGSGWLIARGIRFFFARILAKLASLAKRGRLGG